MTAGVIPFSGNDTNNDLTSNSNFQFDPSTGLLYNSGAAGLALGTSSATVSALLTMSSTTKGFLPPVMTSTQRNAISTPATGLVVYDSTSNALYVYNGTAWAILANATPVSQTNTWQGIWSASQSGNINYYIDGNLITLDLPPVLSNANTASTITNVTALPSAIRPVATKYIPIWCQDDGIVREGTASIATSGTITISLTTVGLTRVSNGGSFLGTAATSTSGFFGSLLQYSIDV